VSVVAAVERDLAKLPADLRDSALAATALVMAKQLDYERTSPTARSMCARVLLDTLDRLRELAPEDTKKDKLDDLAGRRAARLAAAQG
jgi:hypothetical protein